MKYATLYQQAQLSTLLKARKSSMSVPQMEMLPTVEILAVHEKKIRTRYRILFPIGKYQLYKIHIYETTSDSSNVQLVQS